jgi:hypothetical protein
MSRGRLITQNVVLVIVYFSEASICMYFISRTSTSSTLVIRKESSDSSHECIILDVIHHVLIKNICICAV